MSSETALQLLQLRNVVLQAPVGPASAGDRVGAQIDTQRCLGESSEGRGPRAVVRQGQLTWTDGCLHIPRTSESKQIHDGTTVMAPDRCVSLWSPGHSVSGWMGRRRLSSQAHGYFLHLLFAFALFLAFFGSPVEAKGLFTVSGVCLGSLHVDLSEARCRTIVGWKRWCGGPQCLNSLHPTKRRISSKFKTLQITNAAMVHPLSPSDRRC